MKNILFRLAITTLAFLVFWWASTVYYMKYIHDVGGTYWSMGVFGLPVVLMAVWCVDFCLQKNPWFQSKVAALVAIDCLLAIVFYYPGGILVWKAIYVLGIA